MSLVMGDAKIFLLLPTDKIFILENSYFSLKMFICADMRYSFNSTTNKHILDVSVLFTKSKYQQMESS